MKRINRDKQYDSRIAIRLPSKEKQQVEQLIEQGRFKNISALMRAALSKFLEAEA